MQVAVDLMTCLLTALIAARLAPIQNRTRAATIALWLAALCPFTASYTGVVLTETLATFITTLAALIFVCALTHPDMRIARAAISNNRLLKYVGWFFLGGLIVGLGTVVRPGNSTDPRRNRRHTLRPAGAPGKLVETRAGNSLAGTGLALPLMPWAARNVLSIGHVQFLMPSHAETPGDRVLPGFYNWTKTWLVKFRDAYSVSWKLGEKLPIHINAIPPYAFDSQADAQKREN